MNISANTYYMFQEGGQPRVVRKGSWFVGKGWTFIETVNITPTRYFAVDAGVIIGEIIDEVQTVNAT